VSKRVPGTIHHVGVSLNFRELSRLSNPLTYLLIYVLTFNLLEDSFTIQ